MAMRCGMFGKLPAKRDFVTYGIDQPVLELLENWLMTGVSLSRELLGTSWQSSYLAAPIWRFWLGGQVAPTVIAGAIMPSVDKMGRHFPLLVCASAPPGQYLPPPPDAGLNAWEAQAENLLLELLDRDTGEPTELLDGLFFPETMPEVCLPARPGVPLVWTADDGDLSTAYDALAGIDRFHLHASRSYWWTLGGGDHPAQLWAVEGMAKPELYAEFLKLHRYGAPPT